MKHPQGQEDQIAPKLVFVRHGETSWNKALRYQGKTDTHLSPQGLKQAKKSAKLVAQAISERVLDQNQISVVSSPLSRARQTAEQIIANISKPPSAITVEQEFREIALGRWEGLTSYEVKDQFYQERVLRKQDRWHFKPEGGESLAERRPAVEQALKCLKPHSVVVTHLGILRILSVLLGGLGEQEAAASIAPHTGLWIWDGTTFTSPLPSNR